MVEGGDSAVTLRSPLAKFMTSEEVAGIVKVTGARAGDALHHPFTAPVPEDFGRLEDAPGEVRARAYDLALNGTELGGGSIRIHRRDLQERVFAVMGSARRRRASASDSCSRA